MERKQLYYGAAYYPEVWGTPPSEAEIMHMRKLRLNFVRMGEFAWSALEPEMDEFHPDLFIESIERFGAAGIDTVFCTPGATPPVWMTAGHEERCTRNRDGLRLQFGGRQHVCINNPEFRERTAWITRKLIETLGHNPHVIGWQIDNELCSSITECCCDSCRKLWTDYLRKRYGSIEELNALWHTAIWSMTFRCFEDVPAPGRTTFGRMTPQIEQVYREFYQESAIGFQDIQLKIIRAGSNAPVTLNDGASHHLARAKQFQSLDFASVDCYAIPETHRDFLAVCDIFRNLKKGVPFQIMETAPAQSGSLLYCGPIHPENYVLAETAAAFALGANGLAYWHFRQHPGGHEMPHSALLTAWGTPSVGYSEASKAGQWLEEHRELLLNSSPERSPAALNCSDLGRIQCEAEPLGNHKSNFYFSMISELAALLRETVGGVELLPDNAAADGCRLLWSAGMPHLTAEQLKTCASVAEKGGVWIAGPCTGYRTRENCAYTESGLSPELEALAQVRTVWSYLATGREASERGVAFGVETSFTGWSSFFESAGAQCTGLVTSGRSRGKAFLTETVFGKGRIVLLGSMPTDDFLRTILNHYAQWLKLPPSPASPGSILVPRHGKQTGKFAVAVNLDGLGGVVSHAGKNYCLAPFEKRIIFED